MAARSLLLCALVASLALLAQAASGRSAERFFFKGSSTFSKCAGSTPTLAEQSFLLSGVTDSDNPTNQLRFTVTDVSSYPPTFTAEIDSELEGGEVFDYTCTMNSASKVKGGGYFLLKRCELISTASCMRNVMSATGTPNNVFIRFDVAPSCAVTGASVVASTSAFSTPAPCLKKVAPASAVSSCVGTTPSLANGAVFPITGFTQPTVTGTVTDVTNYPPTFNIDFNDGTNTEEYLCLMSGVLSITASRKQCELISLASCERVPQTGSFPEPTFLRFPVSSSCAATAGSTVTASTSAFAEQKTCTTKRLLLGKPKLFGGFSRPKLFSRPKVFGRRG